MELLCPECMGALAVDGHGHARCTIHGGDYQILFCRAIPPVLAQASSLSESERATARAQKFAGHRCVQHPAVPATAQCQVCGGYMCTTCDFVLPGDTHLCPSCATKPQTDLSPKRRKGRAWSFACAIWSTLGVVLIFSGAFAHMARDKETVQQLGMMFMLGILVPAIIGLSVGFSAIDRRRVNPPSLWVAAVWNGVIIAIFILLCIVGSMRR